MNAPQDRLKQLYHLHRLIGIWAVVGVVLFSLSGVLHPIMSRLQPKPAMPQAVESIDFAPLHSGQPLAEILTNYKIEKGSELKLVQFDGVAYLQLRAAGSDSRRYISLADRTELADGDRIYAEFLARRYLGDDASPIVDAAIQRDFDGDYADVNRLLPVWRLAFDRPDGMMLYVDTGSGRLATLVDRTKSFASTEFSLLHRGDWLNPLSPWLRVAVLTAMLLACLGVVIIGLWLYLLRWPRLQHRLDLHKAHRIGGLVISLAALAFAVSGLYHLWHKQAAGDAAFRSHLPEAQLAFAGIADPWHMSPMATAKSVSLVALNGNSYWRFEPAGKPEKPMGEHDQHGKAGKPEARAAGPIYLGASDGIELADGERLYALSLLQLADPARAEPKTLERVGKFTPEYGFLFKRLPVQRAGFADGTAIYVDTMDRQIAAVIVPADRVEGWFFSNIHKLNFLDAHIGKDMRDLVAALLAFALIVVSLLGSWLWWRRRRRLQPVA